MLLAIVGLILEIMLLAIVGLILEIFFRYYD
jgi:hypothetical protein